MHDRSSCMYSGEVLGNKCRFTMKSEFDLIAVGRALLSDPDWANKVQDGKEDQIVPFDKSFVENYV